MHFIPYHYIGFLTPSSLHYVRNHGPPPKASWKDHRIHLGGLAPSPITITMADLWALPRHSIPALLGRCMILLLTELFCAMALGCLLLAYVSRHNLDGCLLLLCICSVLWQSSQGTGSCMLLVISVYFYATDVNNLLLCYAMTYIEHDQANKRV